MLLAVLALDDLLHVLEGDLRRGVAQLGELGLELLAVLLGHEADVEERHDLAELHRRALHRPQRGDDLLGGLELARSSAASRLLLVGARDVRRARAELLGRLRGGEAPTFAERLSREVGIASFLAMVSRRFRARPCYPAVRSTCEPGTMSSRPSGQRTQALWPPS